MKNSDTQRHWSDVIVQRLLHRHAHSDQPIVCAAGISPSGTVHIGNFREIITVDFVIRALQQAQARYAFYYFWDDFDSFRKIPHTLSQYTQLIDDIRKPLSDIADPHNRHSSYARYFEAEAEAEWTTLGIQPHIIYQNQAYKQFQYTDEIRIALQQRQDIRRILNQHRQKPLDDSWWPITIYSEFTNKDTTTILEWDGAWEITYRCDESRSVATFDIRKKPLAKLRWRIDWPMRWSSVKVDFEPGGKDHHSHGGSFETAQKIAEQIYAIEPPISIQYDFIRIKGGSGKMSSSTGIALSIGDVLRVYQPEVLRYLFASTRPNAEFAISFDIDVIKVYEDYDRCERIYFGAEQVGEKRREKERRIYQLSQTNPSSKDISVEKQISFRHLCNVLQIYDGDIDAALQSYPDYLHMSTHRQQQARTRAYCAWSWITEHAPPTFRFALVDPQQRTPINDERILHALHMAADTLEKNFSSYTADSLHAALYKISETCALTFKELCAALYQILIQRDQGPKLANFILLIGKKRMRAYLDPSRFRS